MTDNISFRLRSLSKSPYVPRQSGLSVAVADNIYYFGGFVPYDEVTDLSRPLINVFNTTSSTWSQVNTKTKEHYNSTNIYGVAIGANIWILDGDKWHCFDTQTGIWADVTMKMPDYGPGYTKDMSLAVIDDIIMLYYSSRTSGNAGVICFDTQNMVVHAPVAGYGDLPFERDSMYVTAIAEDLLFLYLPFYHSNEKQAIMYGELFYYDTKQIKWTRVEQHNRPTQELKHIGVLGHRLLFRDTIHQKNNIWVLDLLDHTWTAYPIETGSSTIYYATLLGNKIYFWMNDGQMHAIDVNQIVNDQTEQKRLQVVMNARQLLEAIKPPVEVIDEYRTEPIVVDTELEEVKLSDLEVHEEIPTNFKALFPLIDPTKIVSSTVPAPSETVRMHKNYLHYLTLAWSNHFSVVLSPDIIFFTILCEVADEILSDPDSFRHLFTDSVEKKQIMSLNHNAEQIDVNQLVQGIAKNMPVDASIFSANFTSSTPESQLAIQSAFCEAMSSYYYYAGGRCGIPRVKVLGTKEDWQMIEHKVHRMRTEVFNHDATADKKLSTYLSKIETQVRKIYTTRDPSFWKDMFSIDNCVSGHSDVVNGWITLFYRVCQEHWEHGHTTYSGNDFYNYRSHIATFKWQNVETERYFELKSGLVSSRIVQGTDDELDAKYPWLEPSFSHVIVETNGSGKMSPEEYKTYINDTLQGQDKDLMLKFYELLKDDPMEFVKGGDKELSFRYKLVGRQIDAWKEQFINIGQGMKALDLNSDNCAAAFGTYHREFKRDVHQHAANELVEKIREYLNVNQSVKSVNVRLVNAIALEADIVKALVGYSSLEELHLTGLGEGVYDQLAELLLHSNCNLRVLCIDANVSGAHSYHSKTSSTTNFALSLLKTTAPLESLSVCDIRDFNVDLAAAIGTLCHRENSLKAINFRKYSQAEASLMLLRSIVTSKTLEEINLFSCGSREVIEGNKKKYVPVFDDEQLAFVLENLRQNPSLKVINSIDFDASPAQKAQILSIPTLQVISQLQTTDFSFLKVTNQLRFMKLTAKDCTAEQIEPLCQFLSDERCPLKELNLFYNRFTHEGTISAIARSLTKNRSIEKIDLATIELYQLKNKSEEIEVKESLADWLSSDECPLVTGHLSLTFNVAQSRRILQALVNNTKLKQLRASLNVGSEDYDLLMDLVTKNSTLCWISSIWNQSSEDDEEWTDEQILTLRGVVEASRMRLGITLKTKAELEAEYADYDSDDY